jgi:ABC-type transporter Mla maintaining outer membrane lipid asymmetry permease subunit MlaE
MVASRLPTSRGRCGSSSRTPAGMYLLLRQTLYWTFVAPFREKTEHRRHTFPLMEAFGNKSFGIVALVAFLIGVHPRHPDGYILERYGQVRQVSGLVAVTMTRELGR